MKVGLSVERERVWWGNGRGSIDGTIFRTRFGEACSLSYLEEQAKKGVRQGTIDSY